MIWIDLFNSWIEHLQQLVCVGGRQKLAASPAAVCSHRLARWLRDCMLSHHLIPVLCGKIMQFLRESEREREREEKNMSNYCNYN